GEGIAGLGKSLHRVWLASITLWDRYEGLLRGGGNNCCGSFGFGSYDAFTSGSYSSSVAPGKAIAGGMGEGMRGDVPPGAWKGAVLDMPDWPFDGHMPPPSIPSMGAPWAGAGAGAGAGTG
ncbi:unnamed protein product, partial [Discosporangium mesarthrocarpum]